MAMEVAPAEQQAMPVAQQPQVQADAVAAAEEEEVSFTDIDALQAFGCLATDLKKLKEAGFLTVESVLMTTKKVLCNVKGISEAKVEKLLDGAKAKKNCNFITGQEALQARSKVMKLSTGSAAVDTLLGGGVETCSITEIFGEHRCGKTQLCFTMAVKCQLPQAEGGGNGKVCLLDTEGTFRPERIRPIAEHYGLDPDAVLENIVYCRIYSSDHLLDLISKQLPALLFEHGPFRLLILDSATAPFRVDFQGRGELADRQQKLGKMLSTLTKMSETYNIATIVTNQVMSNPDGMAGAFMSDPKKPVGGHVMAHACATRVQVKKGRGETRIMSIIDSPSLPTADASYQLTDYGVTDATE